VTSECLFLMAYTARYRNYTYCTNLRLRAKECSHAAVNRHYGSKLWEFMVLYTCVYWWCV